MDERLEKALRSTKASLAMDGLYLRPEEEALVRENLAGKITDEEFRRRVLELINKPSE